MTPEIVARVDAWIEARAPAGRGDPLVWLVNDWRKACALWRHRLAKDPEDVTGAVASAQAVMDGLLIGLVREARAAEAFVCELPYSTLVAALESAPRREADA